MRELLKNTARVIILIWFVALSALVLIPSFKIFFGSGEASSPESVPGPPKKPALPASPSASEIDVYKQNVQLYGSQVQVYQSEVTAYTKYLEARPKSSRAGCDECSMAVQKTLVSLLSTTLASLLAFAFVSAGAQVLASSAGAQRAEAAAARKELEIL
jgi:hypothetical protein